jgi:hypothetical protein
LGSLCGAIGAGGSLAKRSQVEKHKTRRAAGLGGAACVIGRIETYSDPVFGLKPALRGFVN